MVGLGLSLSKLNHLTPSHFPIINFGKSYQQIEKMTKSQNYLNAKFNFRNGWQHLTFPPPRFIPLHHLTKQKEPLTLLPREASLLPCLLLKRKSVAWCDLCMVLHATDPSLKHNRRCVILLQAGYSSVISSSLRVHTSHFWLLHKRFKLSRVWPSVFCLYVCLSDFQTLSLFVFPSITMSHCMCSW